MHPDTAPSALSHTAPTQATETAPTTPSAHPHARPRAQHVAYQTVGANRDKPRLWMEGSKLESAGFAKGACYQARTEGDTLILTLDPQGPYRVSGKIKDGAERALIDLRPDTKGLALPVGARVRVLFQQGTIRIRVHHEANAQQDRERIFRERLGTGTLLEASMFTGGAISTHAIHTALAHFGQKADLAWVVDADPGYLDVAARGGHCITDHTMMLVGRAEEIEPVFYSKVDILSFSMPCSTFSKAGKAKHGQRPEEHEGATALFGTMAAIRAANPAVLISENVVEAQHAPAYVLLKAELARLGYVVFERVMDARDTGSVEQRSRYWFVALSAGIAEGFDFTLVHKAALAPTPTIAELLDPPDSVPEDAWFDPAYFEEKAVADAAAGKGFRRQVLTGAERACGTIGRFYAKRRGTEPFLRRADGMERLFTPREHARMKSVPVELIAAAGATRAHEILGQSVDWRQAYIAMGAVLSHLFGALAGDLARAPRSAV